MTKGRIAHKQPAVFEIEPGTYRWCRCGQSENQPYCDGSHVGSQFTPLEFTVEQSRKIALCQCKQTNNPPFCDGSHSNV